MCSSINEGPYNSPTFGKSLSLKVDGGFNAVSINPSGRDIVLASRQGLYIIDLDDPFTPPRWLHHITPWQVADVQWSPHPAKPYWIVSTSNQKAIIWNLAKSSSNAIEFVLHGHSRAITDINFNPQHPDVLATCSVDTYVHAWDMRSPHRPFYSTSSWRSAASQVKWNYKDPNVLASSHGNDIFVWDLRKGSTPLCSLKGHVSSVNSIDFNRFKYAEIMSSSNDGTVKFWDYSKSTTESKRTVTTNFPIWRGRYLPFGEGYCIMPMVGGNNAVYLVNLCDDDDSEQNKKTKLQPIYAFKGHSDRVIDFLWRSRHTYDGDYDDREFQLVTWSKDCDLKLWPISDSIYGKVNFDRGKRLEEKLPDYDYCSYNKEPENRENVQKNEFRRLRENFVTTSGLKKNKTNHITWLSGIRMNSATSQEDLFNETKIQNLGEEVSAIGHKFPKVVFEKISVSTRELCLTLNGPWSEENPDDYIFLRISINFPPNYPNKGDPPKFTIEENSNLTMSKRQEILSNLATIGQKYTDSNLYCLEPCIRFVLGEKVSLEDIEEGQEPLLNFDIADHIDFEELSSLDSSYSDSQNPENLSSQSDTESYKEALVFPDTTNQGLDFGRNLALDTTPVPNGCGSCWTATGELFCFFANEKKPEKKQNAIIKLSQKEAGVEKHPFKIEPQVLYDKEVDSSVITAADELKARPKRYVDTLGLGGGTNGDSRTYFDDETSSDDSFDSVADDWDDILRNDVIVRTKIPILRGNFKAFSSVHSESGKTVESTKKNKNLVISKNFSSLLSDRKELALEYLFMDATPEEFARNNALVAEKFDLDEISHCWQILSDMLIDQSDYDPYTTIWNNHPMGIKWFIKEAIVYFERQQNLQMLAMLCCVILSARRKKIPARYYGQELENMEGTIVFNDNESQNTSFWKGSDAFSTRSRSSTVTPNFYGNHLRGKNIHGGDNSSIRSDDHHARLRTHNTLNGSSKFTEPAQKQGSRAISSSPFHSRMPDIKVELLHDDIIEAYEQEDLLHLEVSDIPKFQTYIYQYSKLLFRWGLPLERVKILKVSTDFRSSYSSQGIPPNNNKKSPYNGVLTHWIENNEFGEEKFLARNCNYCDLRVTRSSFICGNCQHVLHSSCARIWWEIGDECPSGCGCNCPEMFDA